LTRRLVAPGGHHEDRELPKLVLPAHELEHLVTADVRHVQIEDDQVVRRETEPLERFEAARGVLEVGLRQTAQTRHDHLTHHRAVVDHEYLRQSVPYRCAPQSSSPLEILRARPGRCYSFFLRAGEGGSECSMCAQHDRESGSSTTAPWTLSVLSARSRRATRCGSSKTGGASSKR